MASTTWPGAARDALAATLSALSRTAAKAGFAGIALSGFAPLQSVAVTDVDRMTVGQINPARTQLQEKHVAEADATLPHGRVF